MVYAFLVGLVVFLICNLFLAAGTSFLIALAVGLLTFFGWGNGQRL